MLNRCSTPRSSSTPASDDNMPPSKAMLTFLRATAGKSKERKLSCCMTGVALLDRSFDQASAPESCGESRLPATSVAQKSCHHELFGLNATLDALFDRGLISFDDQGFMLILPGEPRE